MERKTPSCMNYGYQHRPGIWPTARILSGAALLLAFQPDVAAQTEPGARRPLYLNTVLGVSAPGFGDLNAELQRAGHLPLAGAYLTRGAGFYTIFP